MAVLLLQQLTEDHTVIPIRMTELERFLSCPLSYKESEVTMSDASNFGTQYHSCVELYTVQKDNYDSIKLRIKSNELLKQEEKNLMYGMLYQFLQKYPKRHDDYTYVAHEQKYTVDIHLGPYLFRLSGTFDYLATHNQTEKLCMFDYKTAKTKRNDYMFKKKIQRRGYPLIYGANNPFGKDVHSMTYLVQTKALKPTLEERYHFVDLDESRDNFGKALGFMGKCLTTGERPHWAGVHCNRCSCKKVCPLYAIKEQIL